MAGTILSLDIETYSDVDLSKCGVYRYVEGDFHILLLAYAFDDEDVRIVDLACGESIPHDVLEAIGRPDVKKAAWNAQFERVCLGHYLERTLPPDSWFCTMIHAAALSLPLSLKGAAAVLKVEEQKEGAGEALIRFFSAPSRTVRHAEGETHNLPFDLPAAHRHLPAHDPSKWRQFREYCCQDVRTERAIRKKIERFQLIAAEWDYYHMDQRINDRGVLIDMSLVNQAIACDLMQSEAMTKRAYDLTGLENPNSVSQLKTWLEERGIEMDSLGKKDVAAMIKSLDKDSPDAEALDMLKLRLKMAKSSVKKYQAAERCVCEDGRARGLFQFYGANRTGRFSGRHIQLQNLPQNHIPTLNEARELVKMGCFDMVESIYGNTPDVLSQLIRTMLIPKDGCEFIVADFSAIEARVLAWEAGERWRLDAFERGDDIYCASASQMFGVPVVKHGVNGELRQKGKIAELACIAEDSLVLTDQGLVPIQDITTNMKLWDGEEWVSHDGVVYRGEREVVTYAGLTATPDHLVFIERQAWPVRFEYAAASGARLIQTGDGGDAIWLGKDHRPREKMERVMEQMLCPDRMPRMRLSSMAISGKFDKRHIKRLPELHAEKANPPLAGETPNVGQTTLRESQRRSIQQLWCARNPLRFPQRNGSRVIPDTGIRFTEQSIRTGQDRYQRALCTRQSSLRKPQNKLCESTTKRPVKIRSSVLALCAVRCDAETIIRNEQKPGDSRRCGCGTAKTEKLERNPRTSRVYDIRNAGRHHRFTVSGHLVHNCGYGGGTGALVSMGALDMGLKESELPGLINDWREANSNIVKYWRDVEKAAIDTVKDHKERRVNHLKFRFEGNALWMVLPSGRSLVYLNPRLQPNRFGRMALTFEGIDAANKWSRQETYSGKLVENATQAIARDLLTAAMLRMEQAGLEIVAHVHDEVIIEAPRGKYAVKEVCEIMNQAPAWCQDLPLSSAGYKGNYYFKD